MPISPSSGPTFDLVVTRGLVTVDGALDSDVVGGMLLDCAADDAATDASVRGAFHRLTGDPRVGRWRSEEIVRLLSARTNATCALFLARAEAKPVLRVAVVSNAPPPPTTVVLPPPVSRSGAGGNPSPAAQAFVDASESGAPTVCKGPCAACGHL